MRRFHENAHRRRADSTRREADRRRLRHCGHTRFRSNLGLHIVPFGIASFIVTFIKRFGNSDA
jgi:hypothetical protein